MTTKDYMGFMFPHLPEITSVPLPLVSKIDGVWEGGEAILGHTGSVDVEIELIGQYSRSWGFKLKFLDFVKEFNAYCPLTKTPSDVTNEFERKVMFTIHNTLFENDMCEWVNEENKKSNKNLRIERLTESFLKGDVIWEKL